MPVKPQDASTLIIIRPCQDAVKGAFEVLMVLRHQKSKFAPDVYVFPGGALESVDCDDVFESRCRGLDRKEAGQIIPDMPNPEKSFGAWIAAVRECFEEVGILPAYGPNGSLVSIKDDDAGARFRQYRQELYKKSTSLENILHIENLTLAMDRIFYYSHWITPELSPIRYDVRFFVTIAPDNQIPYHDNLELTDHVWITPQEALRAYAENRFGLVLPTMMTLKELALFNSVHDVIQSTRRKPIETILTLLIERNNEHIEIMPDGKHFGPSPVVIKKKFF